MRLTILTTIYPNKGISHYSDYLIKSFRNQNVKIQIINFKRLYPKFLYPGSVLYEEKEEPDYGKDIKINTIISWNNPLGWARGALLVEGEIINIQYWTHILFPIYFTFALICKFWRKKKVVVTLHNIISHEHKLLSQALLKLLIFCSDFYVVHNQVNKEKFINIYKVEDKKIRVIPLGIFADDEYKIIDKFQARNKLGLPNKKILLFFGTIRDYKGLDVLLWAMTTINKKIQDVLLVIAGMSWTDWKKYQRIIDSNKLNKHIFKKIKYISDKEVSYFISSADLVVMPYKHFDSSSGLIKTIIFFEKPIIVTAVSDLGGLINDQNFVAKPNDATDLANKIVNVLDNPNRLDILTQRVKTIKQNYSWDDSAKQYINFYKEIIKI